MKYLPNCITILRILIAPLLLFIEPFSVLFFVLYTICGISDVLDGIIARKTGMVSRTGQILDSVADTVFFVIIVIIYVQVLTLKFIFVVWIMAICALRTVSLIVGVIRFKKIAFLHTYANKAAGVALFCFPFLYVLSKSAACIMVGGIATVSAVEELLINATASELDRDIKSFF